MMKLRLEGSTTNMFMSGGLEEAPIVGSGGWYNDSLSIFFWRRFILWPSLRF